MLHRKLIIALPIGESASFEVGVKLSNVETSSDIVHYDIIANAKVLNHANSDAFDYEENVHAGYVSFDKYWDKWSLSTGLRVEQTEIECKINCCEPKQ